MKVEYKIKGGWERKEGDRMEKKGEGKMIILLCDYELFQSRIRMP